MVCLWYRREFWADSGASRSPESSRPLGPMVPIMWRGGGATVPPLCDSGPFSISSLSKFSTNSPSFMLNWALSLSLPSKWSLPLRWALSMCGGVNADRKKTKRIVFPGEICIMKFRY